LRALPGIGAYTAGAVAAIAFGQPAAAVDGNVERVMSRLLTLETPLPGGRAEVARATRALVPPDRPGDFAQALMDLGATICTPRGPACGICPWRDRCKARAAGEPERYPVKAKKAAGALRRGAAFVVLMPERGVLLRTRPARGLLGGMAEPPTTPWSADFDVAQAARHAPLAAPWLTANAPVRHVFTHFPLELTVLAARLSPQHGAPPEGGRFTPLAALGAEPLPTVMRKALESGLALLGEEIR
jgi:A/G-specific adenine glycosylase